MTEFLDIVKGSLDSVMFFFFNRFINTNAISFIKQNENDEREFINPTHNNAIVFKLIYRPLIDI